MALRLWWSSSTSITGPVLQPIDASSGTAVLPFTLRRAGSVKIAATLRLPMRGEIVSLATDAGKLELES